MRTSDYVGKTLVDLAKVTGSNYKGWAVFLLRDEKDDTGARMGEAFTLREILRRHPELTDCVVKYSNDYFGQNVLRVIDPRQAENAG